MRTALLHAMMLTLTMCAHNVWPSDAEQDDNPRRDGTVVERDVAKQVEKAFSLYARERAEQDTKLQAELRIKRANEFQLAASWQGSHIARSFKQDARQSNKFALELFKYALYLGHAADLWKARQYYQQTRDILINNVEKHKAVPPKYNGISILQLCNRELDRLAFVFAQLGRRPTKVSVLQSLDEPGPKEFLEQIQEKRMMHLVEARNIEAEYAYAAAIQRAYEKWPNSESKEFGLDVIRSLAGTRKLSVIEVPTGGPVVVGIGVQAKVVNDIAIDVRDSLPVIERWSGKEHIERGWPILVLRAAGTSADWEFLTAALNNGTSVPGQYAFPVREIGAYVAPVRMDTDDGHLALVDSFLVLMGDLARPSDSPPWLNLTFAVNDGEGAYSVKRLPQLLSAARKGWGALPSIPLYNPSGELPVARVYLLQAGAFYRFLNDLPASGKPGRSVLTVVMEKRSTMKDESLEQNWQTLEVESGLSRKQLEDAFDKFLDGLVQSRSESIESMTKVDSAVTNAFRKSFP